VKSLPVYASQLVEELNASVPARCMRPGESLEDHLRYAGQRDLIESLLRRLEATNTSDPTKSVVVKR
jgi:hypothetical protein